LARYFSQPMNASIDNSQALIKAGNDAQQQRPASFQVHLKITVENLYSLAPRVQRKVKKPFKNIRLNTRHGFCIKLLKPLQDDLMNPFKHLFRLINSLYFFESFL
jgi:hypothetical protein